MDSHVLQVNARGLVTAPNPLLVPRDALQLADNVVLERPGFIQSRRGFKRYTYGLGGDIWALAPYAQRIVCNFGTPDEATNLRVNSSNDGTGAWTAVSGTYTNVVRYSQRLRTAEALDNLYFTCEQGVYRLDGNNVATPVGMPKAIGMDLAGPAAVLTGTGGFLADGQCVAYRAVFGRMLDGKLQLGAPSSRVTVANAAQTSGYSAGVARNVVARVLLPKANNTASTALTTDYFVQLYRSGQVANGQTPSDEMQLVFEAYLTAGNISAGYVDVTDKQPDALRGGYLYTNPNTGEEGVRVGILNANEPPPNAGDIAWWRDCLWLAASRRRRGRCRATLQILGTGTGGLTAGDTLSIMGTTYTAIAPGTPAAQQFVVETAYTASVNIERTATNLVAAINKYSGNTQCYAYYISGAAPDAPGKVLVETRLDAPSGNIGISYTGSSPNAFAPSLSATLTATTALAGNQLWFSKPGQPEAVPSVNFLEVGPAGSNILRILPLDRQLYVLSDSGVYRVLGTDFTNFTVDPVDLTCICAAPSSAVTLDGSLYFLTSQGAVQVTEGAVSYISGDIDSDLRALLQALLYNPANGYNLLSIYAFAVAHQLDHRVMFWLPEDTGSYQCNFAYVWDTRARAWTKWYRNEGKDEEGFTCGTYSQSGPTAVGLTMGEQNNAVAGDCHCYVERRTLTAADYQDDVTLPDGTLQTVGIKRYAKWAYQDAGDASVGKHWREVQFLFGASRPLTVSVILDTEVQDKANADEAASVSTTYTTPVNNRMHRLPVGMKCGRSARLGVTLYSGTAQQGFDVAGLAVHFRTFGPRLTRGP